MLRMSLLVAQAGLRASTSNALQSRAERTSDEEQRELDGRWTFSPRPGRPLGEDLADLSHVLGAPRAERHQRFGQAVAQRREAVVHPRRHFLVVGSLHETIGLQLLELLDQHLVADVAHGSPKLAVAGRPALREEVQDQRLPLAGDDPQGRVEAAGEAGQIRRAILDGR